MAKKDKPEADPLEAELAQLDAENEALSAERAGIQARQRELVARRDKVSAALDAKRLAATLSDPQKAALAQHIKAEGIAPTSAVGTPGGVK